VVFETKCEFGWLRSPHSKIDSAEMKLLKSVRVCRYTSLGKMVNENIFFCGEGPRSRSYGLIAALKAYCATL
jgi:hypothetical protein